VRALLLNEPFVITVDTSVTVTMELLLLPMQRSICSISMEASLLDSKHVTIYYSKMLKEILGDSITQHELITLARHYSAQCIKERYTKESLR
jgi:hypothetical protein